MKSGIFYWILGGVIGLVALFVASDVLAAGPKGDHPGVIGVEHSAPQFVQAQAAECKGATADEQLQAINADGGAEVTLIDSTTVLTLKDLYAYLGNVPPALMNVADSAWIVFYKGNASNAPVIFFQGECTLAAGNHLTVDFMQKFLGQGA